MAQYCNENVSLMWQGFGFGWGTASQPLDSENGQKRNIFLIVRESVGFGSPYSLVILLAGYKRRSVTFRRNKNDTLHSGILPDNRNICSIKSFVISKSDMETIFNLISVSLYDKVYNIEKNCAKILIKK